MYFVGLRLIKIADSSPEFDIRLLAELIFDFDRKQVLIASAVFLYRS
jgi:hypothetical protein